MSELHNKNEFDMKTKILLDLFEVIKKQGVSFMILIAVIWYFSDQNAKQDARILDCQNAKFELLYNMGVKSNEVIQENTLALRDLKKLIK